MFHFLKIKRLKIEPLKIELFKLKVLQSTCYQRLTTKHSRQLTDGEVALAQSVFGDTLYMNDIRLKTAYWVFRNYAVSPNGNIYFHYADWIEDFSKESLYRQAWLIHELTHVWQLQQGLKVVRRALLDRRYNYVLKKDKSFFHYGIEQQARMVEDYFVKTHQGKYCDDLKQCIPFL